MENSMKSINSAVNGVPTGGCGPAKFAAFKEG
jgi:hypothetical protein